MELPQETKDRIKKLGRLSVKCNSVSKTGMSFNVQLRPTEAIQVAASLIEIARVLLEDGHGDTGAVQVYNIGEDGETLGFGTMPARIGPKRPRKKKPVSN